jgi:hypothetical protein
MAPRITGAVLRDDTIQRLGGNGDNWYSTWAADGSLYIALCDGTGFPGTDRRLYNSNLYRVEGSPETQVTFHDVPGYPGLEIDLAAENPATRYYGFGTIAVDGKFYQYMDTFSDPLTPEVEKAGWQFNGAKLIYSPDGGTTWHNQDGSTPVRYEGWDERSQDTLVFFKEPDTTFALHSILQMGRDYSLNTDGYVYVYAPDGIVDGTMNRLVMYRVPKDRILDRGAYEYFAGLDAAGDATWSSELADRAAVHTFPEGWINSGAHPYAWQPSVTYNPALGTYLMANWATGVLADGNWFGKPSYLGLYQSDTPWGPWRQFHEDTSWTPGGDQEARCYQPQIFPKWISEDGRSFWLVWTDFQSAYSDEEAAADLIELQARNASIEEIADLFATQRPYYSFNVQKVELTLE